MSLTGSLPGELIDAIIGYLPDRQSIKLCSLISRAWIPWTRVHLFSQVRLVMRKLLPFLHLLQSPYCTFPCYVRQIYIGAFLAEAPYQYHNILLDVLNGPHPWLDQSYPTTRDPLRKFKTSIVNLIDRNMRSHVINLIHLFPAVEHLHLGLWAYHYGVGECHGLPSISSTLKSLTLSTGSFPAHRGPLPHKWTNFLKWVHRHQIFGIRALYLDVMAPWNMEGAQVVLKLQGRSLRHLHIGPLISLVPHPPLDVFHNTDLDSVHYELGTKFSSQVAVDMFAAISSNKITTVGFDVRHGLLRDVEEACQLKRLGAILASDNFSGLSRILVRLEYDWRYIRRPQFEHNPEFKSAVDYSLNVIYGAFSFAKERGILEVEQLTYERRHSVRDITDDCFSTEAPSRALVAF